MYKKNTILLWLLMIIICQNIYSKDSINIESFNTQTEISGKNIKVFIGDTPIFKDIDFDDTQWHVTSFPLTKKDYLYTGTNSDDILWYRIHLKFPSELPTKTIGINLGKIANIDETYINGKVIGSSGSFKNPEKNAFNKTRIYQIPTSYILPGVDNVLAIKVKNTYRADELPGQGRYYIGDYDSMKSNFLTKGYSDLIFTIVYIVLFTYFLLLYSKRTKEIENLFYSLFSLTFSIYSFCRSDIKYEIIDNILLLQKLEFGSMFLSIALLMAFIITYYKQKHKLYHYIYYVFTIICLIVLIFLKNHEVWYWLNVNIVQYTWLLPIVTIFWILLKNFRKSIDSRIMSLSFGIIALGVLHDMLYSRGIQMFRFVNFYVTSFSMFLLVAGIAVILSIRFANFMTKIEDLNQNLENKVEKRTEALTKANSTLEETLSELEEINKVAKKDMDMASAIQGHLFPKIAPDTDEWSTAYIFKPMAGVSGDLYDFYVDNNEFLGLTLLDVSGHGIASGLITMIAKTISRRNFFLNKKKSLGDIIYTINKEIIKEIDEVDNYLTGIFLRFKNNIVEYVNAGHADLIHKSETTGKVSIINKKDEDFKGWFLGISDMLARYKTLTFKVRPNDLLFIYSDCLNETKNPDGEEYGVDRILDSITNAPNTTPDKILDFIMDDFYKFTQTEELTDDMTAILIKRK
ncbi:MAG: hypothetical protein B6229_04625 [Spirochaetaceae bacterium 4572_7]|nr:MAG: hypothetical protein B6229_04625 [Spirochaetaceae bacterium 4572_7]